jgi:Protein tyrosine and serine/threonine kinase
MSDNNVASVGLTILSFLYAVTLLFCVFRTFHLHKFSPDWKRSKWFYVSVLFQSLLRTGCFLVLFIKLKDLNTTNVFLLISIPDSMFIVSYILLLWQVLLVFSSSHTGTEMTVRVFSKIFKVNENDEVGPGITFTLTAWIGTQISLYLLLVGDIIHLKNISREIGICNFVLSACTISGMIFLQIRYSGVPVRNLAWKMKLSRINLVTLFWTGARILQGIIDILDGSDSTSLSYHISNDSNTLGNNITALLFSVLVVSEIACILMVLDYAFMGIFVFTEEEADYNKSKELSNLVFDPSSSTSLLPSSSLQLKVSMKDIKIICQISARKPTLGNVYRAMYNNRLVFLRKIKFPRMSTYVLEEFSNELDDYSSLENRNIIPIKGVVLDLPTICIITPYIESGSLYKILHITKTKLSLRQKISYARKIANVFGYIHEIKKVHGHLTSENVLINDRGFLYISDLGFNKIKKYAGIVSGYCNKSAWSSPEILKDRRLCPTKIEKSDDVYSFGILLWEMISEQIPFFGYDSNELYSKVVVEGYRPQLPTRIAPSLAEMILSCWSPNPSSRPSFETICNNLNAYY